MKRIDCLQRPAVELTVDGKAVIALEGDTVLTALVVAGKAVRVSEFTGAGRVGFCLMGACQDCWLTVDDRRVRACSTAVHAGMRVCTLSGKPEN